MATSIRPEVSRKNRYWISRHRYYELKHFCLQYNEWKKNYAAVDGLITSSVGDTAYISTGRVRKPTETMAEVRMYFKNRMDMVDRAAKAACGDIAFDLWKMMVLSVTENISYEKLSAGYDIPCCKDVWYAAYRRFYWFLDKERK